MGTRNPQEIRFRDPHGKKEFTAGIRLLNEKVSGSWGNVRLRPNMTLTRGRGGEKDEEW